MRDSEVRVGVKTDDSGAAGRPDSPMTRLIQFHPWYGLATLLYMAGITMLSSIPGHPARRIVLIDLGLNLGHIPLFAGLTILMLQTIAPKRRPFLPTSVLACVAGIVVAFAALDEWHQAFVPGRSASIVDFGLDMMGMGAVLLFYRLSALVSEEA